MASEISPLNPLQTTAAPRTFHRPLPADDKSRLESLAFRHGTSYDSYLAAESDRHVFWARHGDSAVAYVRDGRYIHIAGGLLAAPDSKSQLLAEIVHWADRERLVLTFYNLTDDDLPLVRDFGFQVTKWGEEALIDLTTCSWLGKPYEWIRRQTNFCRRQRVVV
ncbi:MAG TPA: phosphatidylglycerol lysyltransferase domain-containing protein, partial [Pirellulales bacterium]|nr:phosphatidylglycerol lysyltransferase domain-containing protein [Pirellulales bacterium]